MTIYLFLAPALLMVFMFTLLPALWAIYVSTTNLALAGPFALNYKFVGLKNYSRLLSDPTFFNSLFLSLVYTTLTNIGQFTIGMAAALLLSRRKLRAQGILMAIMVLPMVIPGVIQALAWVSMLAPGEFGTLNRFVQSTGLQAVNWLQQAPMLSIVLVNFWNHSGFAMILFLAGLENIPQEILDASVVDGASGWQSFIHIKVPLIRYVILLWLLLNTLGLLGMFDLVYTLTQGGPGHATELLGIYIFNQGFKYLELGYGSAASLIMLIIALLLGLLYVRLLRVEL